MSHVKVYNKKQKSHHILTEKAAKNLPDNGNYIIGEACDAFGRTNNFNNFLTKQKDEQRETIAIGTELGKQNKSEQGNESGGEQSGNGKPASNRKKNPAQSVKSGNSRIVERDDDDDE